MKKIYVQGGKRLQGTVKISGAKNSAVALLPVAIMATAPVTLDGIPDISDIQTLKRVIASLNGHVVQKDDRIIIDASTLQNAPLLEEEITQLRASYYLMGALLGRFKKAVVRLPGGCYLGPRPIDQHIKGFQQLGATVLIDKGAIHLEASELKGARIYLDVVSVGATINIMLAATLAKGRTIIENAAKEPEIIDVATLLNSMGAKISGVGTDVIRIDGVEQLQGCYHSIIPDRIEAGTYMILSAAIGEKIKVDNIIPQHLEALTAKLREMGVKIDMFDDYCIISNENKLLKAVNIKTLPYPGFPTDLQQPFSVLMSLAQGTSTITDTIYNARFKQLDEMRKMNVKYRGEKGTVMIEGETKMTGARVYTTDLRAGAALIIAALRAEGTSEILGVHHIERGYENIIEKLQCLGATIYVEVTDETESAEKMK